MNAFWAYFWPPFGAGLAVGIIAADFAFRRRAAPYLPLAVGVLATLALVALWHGPAGAADRFSTEVERGIRQTIVYWEIPQVSGHLHHGPLTRRAILAGPADDFQRSELARYISQVPGVSSASWSAAGAGVPLIVEGAGVGLLGFLFGLFAGYLRDIRRRYNAQWNW